MKPTNTRILIGTLLVLAITLGYAAPIQAVTVTVELRDSSNALILNSGATIIYQPFSSGAYVNFGDGAIDNNGMETADVPAGRHRFRLTYQNCTQEKQMSVGEGSIVTYQTHLVTIELIDSEGNYIQDSSATIVWQPGSGGAYVPFGDGLINDDGVNTDGTESMEVLPRTHRFRLTYMGTTQEKQSSNPMITYQTTNVGLQFSGAITYQAGGSGPYNPFPSYNKYSPSTSTLELLPASYRFRFDGGYEWQTTISGSQVLKSIVIIMLVDSNGKGLGGSTVQYQTGSPGGSGPYEDLGPVSSRGSRFALPDIRTGGQRFRLTYEDCVQEKQQYIVNNSYVVYQTHKVMVELRDKTTGQLVQNYPGSAIVTYQGGSDGPYTAFGSIGSNGTVCREVLPMTHRYHMNGGLEKQTSGTPVTYYLDNGVITK